MEIQCVRETSEESEEQLKKGAINERLNRRRKRLNEMLSKKRLFTHPIELIPAKGVPVQEEIMEGQQKKRRSM